VREIPRTWGVILLCSTYSSNVMQYGHVGTYCSCSACIYSSMLHGGLIRRNSGPPVKCVCPFACLHQDLRPNQRGKGNKTIDAPSQLYECPPFSLPSPHPPFAPIAHSSARSLWCSSFQRCFLLFLIPPLVSLVKHSYFIYTTCIHTSTASRLPSCLAYNSSQSPPVSKRPQKLY
jgi:hypothetical protein